MLSIGRLCWVKNNNKGKTVFKKFISFTPIIIVSIGMSACSTAKKPNTQKSIIKATTIQTKAPVETKETKVEIAPVVYEKRSPRVRKRAPARRVVRRIPRSSYNNSFGNKLSNAALGRLRSSVTYNGSYVKIAYPWGDVPPNIGVCTDVVIRSYRKLGIDLQQQVHQDMSAAFNSYPNPRKWGLSRPDTNIDHRRVYNLRNFFARRGAGVPITRNPSDYRAGDLVTWMVGPDLPHIGVVVNRPSKADPRRKMIVHNIANGPEMEDVLFKFPITGHYRYTKAHMGNIPKAQYAARKPRRNSNSLSQAQLSQAANLLAIQSKYQKALNQNTVNKVDDANALKSNKPITIALNKDALSELLSH